MLRNIHSEPGLPMMRFSHLLWNIFSPFVSHKKPLGKEAASVFQISEASAPGYQGNKSANQTKVPVNQ